MRAILFASVSVFLFSIFLFILPRTGTVIAATYCTTCDFGSGQQRQCCSIDCGCGPGGQSSCLAPPGPHCVPAKANVSCGGPGEGASCSCSCGGGGGGGSSCDAPVQLSGQIFGRPPRECVLVYKYVGGANTHIGTMCATNHVWSITALDPKLNYLVIPDGRGNTGWTVSPRDYRRENVCSNDDDLNFTWSKKAPSLSCESISIVNGNTNVTPGEAKILRVKYNGGTAPFTIKWSQATTGQSGTFSSLVNTNPTTWTAPNNLTATQNWTITARISDASRQISFCTRELTFTYTRPTHFRCNVAINVCEVVDGAGISNCTAGIPCGEPPVGYFETFGGTLTALASLTNPNLPSGKALSQKTPNLDAGVVKASDASLPSGTKYSERGSVPADSGYHLVPYDDESGVPSYDDLLTPVLQNARLTSISEIPTLPGHGWEDNDHGIKFWRYTSSSNLSDSIAEALRVNVGSDILYHVFVPDPDQGNGARDISITGEIDKTLLVFVNGKATFTTDTKVSQSSEIGGLMTVSSGKVEVRGNVKKADGFHLFSGNFDDQDSDDKLEGFGSLIGSSETAFVPEGFNRKYTTGGQAAEKWTFDGRYLTLYTNILTRPKLHWEELTPE